MITQEGGIAVRLINKTGAPTVKGSVVHPSSAVNNAFVLAEIGVPDPIGVVYEDGIPDGDMAWVVINGVAEVLFVSGTTRAHMARTFLSTEAGSFVAGQALSEPLPSSPFATDKHFCEIGHVLETRIGAGLAKCTLHFN